LISTRRGPGRAEEKAAQERRCLAEKEAQEKTLSSWRGGKKRKKRSCSRKTKTVGVLEERRKEDELKEDSDGLLFPSVGNGL
jgi:hypothetical protein